MKLPERLPTLEEQVCTIEQSKELWELGVRGMPTLFYYIHLKDGPWNVVSQGSFAGNKFYNTYTVAELGFIIKSLGRSCTQIIDNGMEGYMPVSLGKAFPTEAQARAGLLIESIKSDNEKKST